MGSPITETKGLYAALNSIVISPLKAFHVSDLLQNKIVPLLVQKE